MRDLGRNYPTWYMPIAVSEGTDRLNDEVAYIGTDARPESETEG